MSREAIYAAIFKLAPAGLVTTSRRLKSWEDLEPEQMPALFQQQLNENKKGVGNMPGVLKGGVTWWLYCYADEASGQAPSQIMNPFLDAIEAAFQQPAARAFTLGGLVSQCYIDGTIETDEGYLGDVAVARIPIVFTIGG